MDPWNAVEALGTWAGVFASVVLSVVAIWIAIRANKESTRAIHAQLMPVVTQGGETKLNIGRTENRQRKIVQAQVRLENQGAGPALMVRVSGMLNSRLFSGEFASIGPHKSVSKWLKGYPLESRTTQDDSFQFCVEFKDCLNRDYVTVLTYSERADEIHLDNVELQLPDFHIGRPQMNGGK